MNKTSRMYEQTEKLHVYNLVHVYWTIMRVLFNWRLYNWVMLHITWPLYQSVTNLNCPEHGMYASYYIMKTFEYLDVCSCMKVITVHAVVRIVCEQL